MTTGNRFGTRRARAKLAATLVAIVTLGSGCFLANAEDIQQTKPADRPWFCKSTGTGTDHVGHPNVYYPGMVKGTLSWADCLAVADMLDKAWGYAQQYPTRGKAEASGFKQTTQYVAGMGTHHTKDAWGPFDPAKPLYLQYGGTTPDAPLVAMSWFVGNQNGPPAGFPGLNDWWHTHATLCYKPGTSIVIGNELTDAQCRAIGGNNLALPDLYMAHTWIVPGWEYKPDVFAGAHPCLLATGIAPKTDPCWAVANAENPAGAPPGTLPPGATTTMPPMDHGN